MEGFERPPTRRGASRGGRIPFFERHRRENARSAGANLSAEDLQRRLLAIGNAAKARNPDGFVDELKRRVGPSGDDDDLKTVAAPAAPPEPAASWFCLEPATRLEKALARGDATEARMARKEATATLKRIAADGALTYAWCRSLVREGADVGEILAPIKAADRKVALTLFDQWIQGEGDACFPWLALAAPQAAAKLLVFAKTCRAFLSSNASQMIRSVAIEINAALERRGLPAPDGWETLLTLTKAEHKAVLQAIGQLDGSATQRKVRRAAEAILGTPEGSLDCKKAAVMDVCKKVMMLAAVSYTHLTLPTICSV